mgnify:CR=1 FL=1
MTTELSSFFQQYLPHLSFVLNRFASIETFVRLYYRIYDYLNSRGNVSYQIAYDYGQLLISNLIQSFDVTVVMFPHE